MKNVCVVRCRLIKGGERLLWNDGGLRRECLQQNLGFRGDKGSGNWGKRI